MLRLELNHHQGEKIVITHGGEEIVIWLLPLRENRVEVGLEGPRSRVKLGQTKLPPLLGEPGGMVKLGRSFAIERRAILRGKDLKDAMQSARQ